MADLQRKTANLFNLNAANIIEYALRPNQSDPTQATFIQYTNSFIAVVQVPVGTYTIKVWDNSTIDTVRFGITNKANPQYNDTAYSIQVYSSTTQPTGTITTSAQNPYIIIQVYTGAATGEDLFDTVTISTSPMNQYEPYGWVHSLRKLTTAIEDIENPLYSDGTAITAYTIKGNTVQNGTPSPQNPVMPNGVGERTENIYDKYNVIQVSNLGTRYGSYVDKGVYSIYNDTDNDVYWGGNDFQSRYLACSPHSTATVDMTSYSYSDYGFLMPYNDASLGDVTIVQGETAPDHYIPYGYKIPISNGQGSAVNYLGSVQSTRQIQKLVLTGNEDWNISLGVFYLGTLTNDYLRSTGDITYTSTHYQPYQQQSSAGSVPDGYFGFGNSTAVQRLYVHDSNYSTTDAFKAYLQAQYAAGTPVTVWYVLATATTGIVNEPLMKIGTYTDSISNATAIPTTEGANTITVDTTVQPSEFSATWTGWHNAYVKEKSENLIPTNISDWEQGGISSTDGTDTVSTIRLRTIDFYPINNNTDYYISVNDTDYCYVNIILYDSSKQYAGQYYLVDSAINGATALAINVPSSAIANAAYYRAVVKKQDDSTITSQEIADIKPMLNLGSTPQTYAPYWK